MPEQPRLFSRQRLGLLVVLIILLASIYMLTYSARIVSSDGLFLVDSVGSFVRFGDFKLDLSAGVRPPLPLSLERGALYALPDVSTEHLQIILAAPLYWLAQQLPGIGLVHAVYLFNILVSALTGGVMFLYALVLGYRERSALAAGLMLGLGTIVWPYSKTFFQEPLTLLLLLLTALCIERWRQIHYRSLPWLAGVLLFGLGAILSKGAATLALPGLIVIALPAWSGKLSRRFIWGVLAGGLVIVALLLLGEPLGITGRIGRLLNAFTRPQPFARAALQSYLLSIGASFWATSPVILLAVPGIWLLHRRRQYRYLLVAVLMILTFALVYALRQGSDWFGGLSWPPRFLLPVIAFPLLCALPVIDAAVHRPLRSPAWIGFALLFIFSMWVQFTGVSLWWADYANALPPESGHISEWAGGMYDLRYVRWLYIPPLWAQKSLDFAWVRLGIPGWPLAFGALALVSGLLFRRRKAWWVAGLAVVYVGLTYAGMRAIYDDNLYLAFDPDLHALLPVIDAETQPGDVVLLSDLSYDEFFLNYAKLESARLVSLPDHPGEQPSPEQLPEVVSNNPDLLLDWRSLPMIHALAESRDRIWLLTNNGPFIPWSVRAVEQFMHQHYFPTREFLTGPDSRLIEYSTVPAPAPYAFKGPEQLSDLVYDDAIHLNGYDLPAGMTYAAGDIVPVALYWQSEMPLEVDYKVALLLRDNQGSAVADSLNTEPGGGFAHTSQWTPGVPVWDNRGILLPDTLPAGEYQLWVVVYGQDLDGNVENLPVRGAETREGFIGVLPLRITVE
ncbi:MAG: hypothetical protein K8L99_34185 [Anaerolineae bacterium]|nr:hypothetical protein [Anaerolineae bacterium]